MDFAGVPYFRAYDSQVFVRIAKYFVSELEDTWHNTEINPVGKVFDSTSFINEFDAWQNQFPEELWRLAYERQYKRTYVGGTGAEWDNALPQSNKSDIVSTRFLTEMMNGRKKYQRRCYERNQEIFMSSKFKGEANLNDTITLRGTGRPTGKVVTPNFTLNIVPFSKMYVNLYNATDNIYYHEKHEAGDKVSVAYPNTNLDFIYIRGASQMQSLGDLSPMYLQTAELTSGAKLKTIKLGNATTGYSNDSLKTLQIGAGNKLLEELDIRNLSNLSPSNLPVSNIPSLKRVYAQGSNISEAVFANNGLLEEAYLPETITRLELRNLYYLNKIELESYDNLLHLVVMNCPTMNSRILEIINQASELQTLRVTNVNWTFDNTDVLERLYGLIKNSDSPEVVLSGKVYVSTIRQKEFEDYQRVWSDLEITYDSDGFIPQFPVTFVNYDGTVLETQWVDEGSYAVNPIYRVDNPLPVPTKPSIVSTDYAFVDWDNTLTSQIYSALTVRATYSESVRRYKIKYVISEGDKEILLQESEGDYGTNVPYIGETPTYAVQNSPTYYLFDKWDKSGFIDGDKTVTAKFNSFRYRDGAFNGKELRQLSYIEIYALLKMMETNGTTFSDYGMNIETGDDFSFTMGYDINYDDIDSKELITQKRIFSGSADDYFDTEINLFDVDKDFVLAIDYKMLSGNTSGATLMQCFESTESDGFALNYNSSSVLSWGGSSSAINEEGKTVTANTALVDSREMLVIRHKQGDKNLYAYISNLNDVYNLNFDKIEKYTITRDVSTQSNSASLIFGAAKTNAGRIVNPAKCEINWCKIWYKDLGDDVCRKLVSWTHEEIVLEVSGFNRYQLYDNANQESTISLLATHLLNVKKKYNSSYNNNDGGWASCALNTFLNNRFYNAMPYQIKALMKKMSVKSTIGNNSEVTSTSGCFVNVPALYDVYDDAESKYTSEIYEYTTPIDYFTGEVGYKETSEEERTNRIRRFADSDDSSDGIQYWLRSPAIGTWATSRYCYSIDKNGTPQSITTTNADHGVLIEISF